VDGIVVDVLVKVVEFAPAVGILLVVAWRADQRAQQCLSALIAHLEKEHTK